MWEQQVVLKHEPHVPPLGLHANTATRVEPGSLIELNRALSDKIAKGEVDLQTPGLAEHLWQTTMDKLAVDQPNYGSYKRELGTK